MCVICSATVLVQAVDGRHASIDGAFQRKPQFRFLRRRGTGRKWHSQVTIKYKYLYFDFRTISSLVKYARYKEEQKMAIYMKLLAC